MDRWKLLLPLTAMFWYAGDAAADVAQLSPVRDNTLIEDPVGALSNGTGDAIYTGRTGQPLGSLRRGLLAFNVAAAIPAPVVVTSVQLALRLTDSAGAPERVTLHRLHADWGEAASNAAGGRGAPAEPGDATWLHRFYDTEPWSADGGDFALPPSAAARVAGPGDYMWGSTPRLVADVQAWIDGVAPEHGWLLLGEESRPQTAKRFASREHQEPGAVPVLTIEFERQPSCAGAGLPHAARALCHLYCEVLECAAGPNDVPGCEPVARAYRRYAAGADPLCTTVPTDDCPCFSAADVTALIGVLSDTATYRPITCVDTRVGTKPLTAVRTLRLDGQPCSLDSDDCSALAFEFTEDRICQLNAPAPEPGVLVQGIGEGEREACRQNVLEAASSAAIGCN